MVRNECFRVALDYLYKNGLVADQRELSVKTGLSQKSISHILNNRVQNPSEATIRKLNEAFGNIFNPQYFRCQSEIMLVKDMVRTPQKEPDDKNSSTIIDLAASLIKEVEGFRQQLTAEREALQEERKQLHDEIQNLHQLYTRLRVVSYSDTPTVHLLAAEPQTNKKNE